MRTRIGQLVSVLTSVLLSSPAMAMAATWVHIEPPNLKSEAGFDISAPVETWRWRGTYPSEVECEAAVKQKALEDERSFARAVKGTMKPPYIAAEDRRRAIELSRRTLLVPGRCISVANPTIYFRPPSQPGVWSAEARSLYPMPSVSGEGGRRDYTIASPDGKKMVVVGDDLTVTVNGRRLPLGEKRLVSNLAELEWSQDSTAFFLIEGLDWRGEWVATVFLVADQHTFRSVDITRKLAARLVKTWRASASAHCRFPEGTNVAAIKWLEGAEKLLVAVETPDPRSCEFGGRFVGYLVRVPSGDILNRYRDAEVRARWGSSLGERLRTGK